MVWSLTDPVSRPADLSPPTFFDDEWAVRFSSGGRSLPYSGRRNSTGRPELAFQRRVLVPRIRKVSGVRALPTAGTNARDLPTVLCHCHPHPFRKLLAQRRHGTGGLRGPSRKASYTSGLLVSSSTSSATSDERQKAGLRLPLSTILSVVITGVWRTET